MLLTCTRSTPIHRSPRVLQLEGMFDIPAAATSTLTWTATLPLEERPWNIGLIVGPSGCGKSTLLRELFPEAALDGFEWPDDCSVVDAFPAGLGIREITGLLSSVGFSSPPGWLRPYRVLSNGERFRVTLARTLAESPELAVVDEFTSVVDRTVARIGSAAVAKAVRARGGKFVAASCHDDIVDWLQPDWIFEPASGSFHWRCLQRRPAIQLEIFRVRRAVWRLFGRHHYLSSDLATAARCFLGCVEGRPACFTAVLSFCHPTSSGWREHRTVCLPDFQGVGLGNAMSEYVASLMAATGKPYRSTTSHPAMIRHRMRSPLWRMTRKPSMVAGRHHGGLSRLHGRKRRSSHGRITASFEYCGPARPEDARRFGLLTSR